MKVVLASKNQHKLVEMRDILAAQGVEVVLESEVGADVEVHRAPVHCRRLGACGGRAERSAWRLFRPLRR